MSGGGAHIPDSFHLQFIFLKKNTILKNRIFNSITPLGLYSLLQSHINLSFVYVWLGREKKACLRKAKNKKVLSLDKKGFSLDKCPLESPTTDSVWTSNSSHCLRIPNEAWENMRKIKPSFGSTMKCQSVSFQVHYLLLVTVSINFISILFFSSN